MKIETFGASNSNDEEQNSSTSIIQYTNNQYKNNLYTMLSLMNASYIFVG
jgi:hypothetical protein